MDIMDIKDGERYTQALARSMQNTKEMVAGNILRKQSRTPIYKIHMHAKKDWRVLELRTIEGYGTGYYTHSSYKTHREAQAIIKLLEG